MSDPIDYTDPVTFRQTVTELVDLYRKYEAETGTPEETPVTDAEIALQDCGPTFYITDEHARRVFPELFEDDEKPETDGR